MDTTIESNFTIEEIHHSILHVKNSNRKQRHRSVCSVDSNESSKKVNFADDVDLPLVYIMPQDDHIINNLEEETTTATKTTTSTNAEATDEKVEKKKVLVSNCEKLDEIESLKKFHANKICLHSLEVAGNSCVKGRIYIKINQPVKKWKGIFNAIKRRSLKGLQQKIHDCNDKKTSSTLSLTSTSILEIVYVIWTSDHWKTWKTQEAKLIEQSGNHRIYVFHIENANNLVNVGESIELAACYQIESTVHQDSNNSKFFTIDCVEK